MPVNSFDNYPMSWRPVLTNGTVPLYVAIADMLEKDIKEGVLTPGTKLPPQRELADYLDVNLSTISRAFKLCEQKGLISARVGSGTFVSSDAGFNTILLPNQGYPHVIEMGSVFPGNSLNHEITAILKKMIAQPDVGRLFQYGSPEGALWHKEAAVKLIEKAGYKADPQMILFTNGAQNAITAILAGLFKAGDRIGTDPMTYPGIKTAANMLGIQLVPIKQKDYEITEEGLMYACKNENIKGLYMVPDFQNPTTHTMSVSSRKMIGEIAIKENLIVIEDAIHSLLTERPLAPIASYAPDQVLYISSLSKVISPGLRFGYIAAPEPFKRKLAIALYNFNISVAPLMTELVTQMINTGVTDKILDNHRSFTKDQNSIVDQWLGDHQIVGSPASIFRWLLLPDYFTGESFELRAYQAGVQVYAADRFAVGTAQPQNAVRIAVTAPGNDGGLEQGLRIIKALLESNEEIPSLY